jgi:hypothetical protein
MALIAAMVSATSSVTGSCRGGGGSSRSDAQRRDVSVLGQVDRSAGDACGFFRAPSFSFNKNGVAPV